MATQLINTSSSTHMIIQAPMSHVTIMSNASIYNVMLFLVSLLDFMTCNPLLLVAAGMPINTTWTGNTLLLEWEGRFTSSTPLYYEFSLGTQVGSGSIRRWAELETDQTSVMVTDTRLNQGMDYFLALTAISSAGLHTTADPIVVAGISASW